MNNKPDQEKNRKAAEEKPPANAVPEHFFIPKGKRINPDIPLTFADVFPNYTPTKEMFIRDCKTNGLIPYEYDDSDYSDDGESWNEPRLGSDSD